MSQTGRVAMVRDNNPFKRAYHVLRSWSIIEDGHVTGMRLWQPLESKANGPSGSPKPQSASRMHVSTQNIRNPSFS